MIVEIKDIIFIFYNISYRLPQKHPDNRQCPQLFHLSLQLPEALPGREYIIQQDNILSSDIPPCELQVPQYVLILSLSFQLLAVFLYPDGLETVRNAQPFRQVVAYHRKAFPLSFPCRCGYRYQYRVFLRSVESRMFQTQCQYPCDQLATVSSFLKTEYQVAYPFLVCIRLFNLRWVIVMQVVTPASVYKNFSLEHRFVRVEVHFLLPFKRKVQHIPHHGIPFLRPAQRIPSRMFPGFHQAHADFHRLAEPLVRDDVPPVFPAQAGKLLYVRSQEVHHAFLSDDYRQFRLRFLPAEQALAVIHSVPYRLRAFLIAELHFHLFKQVKFFHHTVSVFNYRFKRDLSYTLLSVYG